MSKIRTILVGGLAVFSVAAPAAYASKVWIGGGSIDLRVGPGINATFSKRPRAYFDLNCAGIAARRSAI